jgi:hypothetical protein
MEGSQRHSLCSEVANDSEQFGIDDYYALFGKHQLSSASERYEGSRGLLPTISLPGNVIN